MAMIFSGDNVQRNRKQQIPLDIYLTSKYLWEIRHELLVRQIFFE